MTNELKVVLERLRKLLGQRSEQAHTEREARATANESDAYAAGEAHAYGVAEMDVRNAEQRGRET